MYVEINVGEKVFRTESVPCPEKGAVCVLVAEDDDN